MGWLTLESMASAACERENPKLWSHMPGMDVQRATKQELQLHKPLPGCSQQLLVRDATLLEKGHNSALSSKAWL